MYLVWAPSQNFELNRLYKLKGVKLPPSKPTKAGKGKKREGDVAKERPGKLGRVVPCGPAKRPPPISTAPPEEVEVGSFVNTKVDFSAKKGSTANGEESVWEGLEGP